MKKDLFACIRRDLREKGLTQRDLAARCGVSLPTVKRWLRGDGVAFDDLLSLLEAAGCSLAEVALAAERERVRTFSYTWEQEEALARSPEALVVFDALLNGIQAPAILAQSGIQPRRFARILRELESIGLIERHPGDRVKVLPRGEPVWRKDGPLAKTFRENAVAAFLEESKGRPDAFGMGVYRLLRKDALKAQESIEELRQFLRSSEARAKGEALRARPFAFLSAFGPFSWEMIGMRERSAGR